MFISDEAFLNLAKPIKAVAHIGCNEGLGFISGIGCDLILGMGGFSLCRQNREFKLNQALVQSSQALVAIKIDSMLSYTTEAGISPRRATFFSCSCKQRRQKNTPRLSASLRFATGKPASRHSGCGAAKLALRYARRSNRLPQICSRCIGTLRCQCPQPEPRAAGTDTRVNSGGLQEL